MDVNVAACAYRILPPVKLQSSYCGSHEHQRLVTHLQRCHELLRKGDLLSDELRGQDRPGVNIGLRVVWVMLHDLRCHVLPRAQTNGLSNLKQAICWQPPATGRQVTRYVPVSPVRTPALPGVDLLARPISAARRHTAKVNESQNLAGKPQVFERILWGLPPRQVQGSRQV